MPQPVANTLRCEGLGGSGHIQVDCNVNAKNGESLLILKDRFTLAVFARKPESAREDAAKEVAATAAAAAAAAKGQPADEGRDVPALTLAAGYGAWPRALLPTRSMVAALKNAAKGKKG